MAWWSVEKKHTDDFSFYLYMLQTYSFGRIFYKDTPGVFLHFVTLKVETLQGIPSVV
jgi:hypothetical protein